MDFQISGLSAEPFRPLYGLSDDALAARGVHRYIADENSGFPDRIEMRDAQPGEALLLLNHLSQPADTPYRATHAIFILEGAVNSYRKLNEVPRVLCVRPQSLRAFDAGGMMLDADLARGAEELVATIERLFSNSAVAYIHAHNAKQGCYAGLIERA